jgi:hypothetical protein
MDPAQYTTDAICRSMGLPAFVEAGWSPGTLRLLLKPSFDPEVCVTLTGTSDAARLSVVALTEMLWRQPAPCALAAWRDQAAVPAPAFAQTLAGFAAALAADRQPEGRMVCLDGMPVTACLLSGAGLEQFACSPYRPEVSAFVSSLVQMAWESCRAAGVRNALAACGRYVGLDLPRDPAPRAPELWRVAVLGTPDARKEFFGVLQPRGDTAESGDSANRCRR